MLNVISGEHVNSTKQFRSIEVDYLIPQKVHFRNPFPEKYSRLTTRTELIRAWNEECKLRAKELDEFYNDINNHP